MPQSKRDISIRALTSVAYPWLLHFGDHLSLVLPFLVCRLGVLQVESFALALDQAIILNPACQPEFRLFPDLFDSYCQGVASQIDHAVGDLQAVRRHRDVA